MTVIRKASEETQITLAYFFNNSICHPSAFIARRLFNDGLFDETYRIAADKKFFIDRIILKNCSILKIEEIITDYDTRGITYQPESKETVKAENVRILAELIPQRLLTDIYFLKTNFQDILTLSKIKRYRLLSIIFNGLKKAATLFRKISSSRAF